MRSMMLSSRLAAPPLFVSTMIISIVICLMYIGYVQDLSQKRYAFASQRTIVWDRWQDVNHSYYQSFWKGFWGGRDSKQQHDDDEPLLQASNKNPSMMMNHHISTTTSLEASLLQQQQQQQQGLQMPPSLPAFPNNIQRRKSNHNFRTNDDDDAFIPTHGNRVSVPLRPENNNIDPKFYGWTPDMYPNPFVTPIRCGIGYLNINTTQTGKTTIATTANRYHHHVRLCDPDWVLGGTYVDQIAKSLLNFSHYYSNKPWDVGVVQQQQQAGRHLQQQAMADSIQHHSNLRQQQQSRHLQSSSSLFSSPSSPQLQQATWTAMERLSRALQMHRNLSQGAAKNKNNNKGQSSSDNNLPPVELGVATVRKMNLPVVLREGSYFTYEDEDDMVNDAAQLFARYIYNSWWNTTKPDNDDSQETTTTSSNLGILIFLSIQDRVCFISTGTGIISHILPWWRLEHVVSNMKPDLRVRDYGHAVLRAIDDLAILLEGGPPTLQDRFHDFLSRFGVVIAFALFTFFFGAWGEYRDRRKRWQYAERRSQLNQADRDKARTLQSQFHTKHCPICLETFDFGTSSQNSDSSAEDEEEEDVEKVEQDDEKDDIDSSKHESDMKRVDSFGIPMKGNDGLPLKILRCGHVFDLTCWRSFVNSGHGNPYTCPVCRQDVGKSKRSSNNNNSGSGNNNNGSSRRSSRRQSRVEPLWHRGFLGRRRQLNVVGGGDSSAAPTETDALLSRISTDSPASNNNNRNRPSTTLITNYSTTSNDYFVADL